MLMAKKEDKPKVVLERTYNVPLRKEWMHAPKYKRAKKAVKALREFMMRHMKSEDIRIGNYANLEIWKRGIKSPPHHIKVTAKKDDAGTVFVELVGAPAAKPKEARKKVTKAPASNLEKEATAPVKKAAEEKPALDTVVEAKFTEERPKAQEEGSQKPEAPKEQVIEQQKKKAAVKKAAKNKEADKA